MRLEVYESAALPAWLGWIAVAGVLVALGAAVIVCFLRARRRDTLAANAEASVGEHPPELVEGRDVVLGGVVRHFEDHDVAVRVRVMQRGSESESSGTWSHAWTEIDREIILAPFILELANGKTVLVHPPRNVDVADALDQKVWINRNQRVLTAELMPGEKIFARGRLERSDQAVAGGAYRDVSWGWALRPAAGQMLLSSEPLGHGMRQRATFHRGHGIIALVLFVLVQVTLVGFYQRFAGHTELVTIDDKHVSSSTDSDGDTTTDYVLSIRGESKEVDARDYNRLEPGNQIPARFGSAHNWDLGQDATIAWYHALILAVVASAFWIIYNGRRRSSRPWFRRKVNESGSGQLPDPPKK